MKQTERSGKEKQNALCRLPRSADRPQWGAQHGRLEPNTASIMCSTLKMSGKRYALQSMEMDSIYMYLKEVSMLRRALQNILMDQKATGTKTSQSGDENR